MTVYAPRDDVWKKEERARKTNHCAKYAERIDWE